MRTRLVLAAAVAASAIPLATPSFAGACNERQFPEVCAALTAVCQSTAATRKVCSQFG